MCWRAIHIIYGSGLWAGSALPNQSKYGSAHRGFLGSAINCKKFQVPADTFFRVFFGTFVFWPVDPLNKIVVVFEWLIFLGGVLQKDWHVDWDVNNTRRLWLSLFCSLCVCLSLWYWPLFYCRWTWWDSKFRRFSHFREGILWVRGYKVVDCMGLGIKRQFVSWFTIVISIASSYLRKGQKIRIDLLAPSRTIASLYVLCRYSVIRCPLHLQRLSG